MISGFDRNSTSGSAFAFWKGAPARQVKTDDLSPDDIIIACVHKFSQILVAHILNISNVASWAQLVQGKAPYVSRIFQTVSSTLG